MAKKKVDLEELEQETDEAPFKPLDSSRDVSEGETITVTIPLIAAQVLANPDGQKLGEFSQAAALLRAELA